MASLDTDVDMVPAGEESSSGSAGPSSLSPSPPPRSRRGSRLKSGMLSPSGPGALSAKLIRRVRLVKSARWLGGFVIMLSISTVSVDGLKLVKFAPWITVSGSSRNMDIKIDVAS